MHIYNVYLYAMNVSNKSIYIYNLEYLIYIYKQIYIYIYKL